MKRVLNPENKFFIYWDLLLFVTSVFVAIESPLVIVFNVKQTPFLFYANMATTVIFFIDIILNFNTGFYQKAVLYEDRKLIASKYLKSWFLVDLIATIPFDLLVLPPHLAGLAKIFKLLRLARLFKLVKVTGIVTKSGRLRINPAILSLMVLVFWVLMIAHFISCVWLLIANRDLDLDAVSRYIKAYYWTITTIATIGYGDITPVGNAQTVFVIFIELIGAAMYGLIIGNIANLISSINLAKTQFKEKLRTVSTFLKYHKIPYELENKVNKYYNYLWESKQGFDEMDVISDLPLPIRTSIVLNINKDIIEKVPLFEKASTSLKKDIILHLKLVIFTPGDYIVTAGDMGEEMFFIAKGSVDVMSSDETKLFATLKEGQFFGEISLLLEAPRTATIKSREYCDLFKLEKHTFDSILKKYPEFNTYVQNLAQERKKELELIQDSKPKEEFHYVPEVKSSPVHKLVPSTPVLDFAVKQMENGIQLTWSIVNRAVAYEIAKKNQISEIWTSITAILTVNYFLDPVSKSDGHVFYKVRAIFDEGFGPWSNTKSVSF